MITYKTRTLVFGNGKIVKLTREEDKEFLEFLERKVRETMEKGLRVQNISTMRGIENKVKV
jgi:hypothetical protein